MKFARLGAAPLPAIILLISACSDPPAPPAQAAVTLSISPAPGKTCTTTNGQLAMPSKFNASVIQELNCDLSKGCKPDDYVVVDHDPGTSVSCTVAPANGNFSVLLSLDVDGSSTGAPSMHFSMSGNLMPNGGMASVNESNSVAGGGGSQQDCTVSIMSPMGVIAKGKVWGAFQCNAFRDERNIGDTGCQVQGQFLFENCDS
jgi:hypothetical protein